ncbi:ornithine-acyl-ACP acyltransferase [Haematobacter massiliensis]|uniref:L-ornithine N(alpha)-acyltransferase n=1 Tax=Haematobacter massiliensis TaxID=195105 RepID=A0A086YC55_9RHOB|nr:GNAT family N-acyltransferase [Haematobacter massiliensis]KFI31855.1 ornithine-acyl-ACP acyltransferase [Haematobacter massiliensis]OWJ87815.1 ornithine-acyl-ACP acyltransferase [Haematobacter massiliensis]QBJ24251.1 GNAT family N-acetyltransferase [Haematobacter massiliensis]
MQNAPLARTGSQFSVRLASTPQDIRDAQRLRYEVFVAELGATGTLVDHEERLECDRYDPFCDHLLLLDEAKGRVAAVYRLLPGERAELAGGFYTQNEYDLVPLLGSGRKLLELGRSCVHADYRGSAAMFVMWSALADYVMERGIEILFGTASFHGTDVEALALPLSWLHAHHLAPETLRVQAWGAPAQPMDLIPVTPDDKNRALAAMPPLIRAYLRLGGVVGEGAWRDAAFNTTDVCLIVDTTHMSAQHRGYYTRGRGVPA